MSRHPDNEPFISTAEAAMRISKLRRQRVTISSLDYARYLIGDPTLTWEDIQPTGPSLAKLAMEREQQPRREPWTREDLKEAGIPEHFIDIAHWYGTLEELKEDLSLTSGESKA